MTLSPGQGVRLGCEDAALAVRVQLLVQDLHEELGTANGALAERAVDGMLDPILQTLRHSLIQLVAAGPLLDKCENVLLVFLHARSSIFLAAGWQSGNAWKPLSSIVKHETPT